MADLITDDLVELDARFGDDPESVIGALADLVAAAGRTNDAAALAADVVEREQVASTGLPGGLAIPHSRTAAVTEPVLAFARLLRPVGFGAEDKPADLVFLIAVPTDGASVHLTVLSALAKAYARPSFAHTLRRAETSAEALETIRRALGSIAS